MELQPILPSSGPLFFGAPRVRPVSSFFANWIKKKFLLEPSIFQAIHNISHAGCQKGGVPEEANNQLYHENPCACMNPPGAPMTAYLRHAVSAAEPLCTHGKDHAGLGAPNSLKLVLVLVLVVVLVLV